MRTLAIIGVGLMQSAQWKRFARSISRHPGAQGTYEESTSDEDACARESLLRLRAEQDRWQERKKTSISTLGTGSRQRAKMH